MTRTGTNGVGPVPPQQGVHVLPGEEVVQEGAQVIHAVQGDFGRDRVVSEHGLQIRRLQAQEVADDPLGHRMGISTRPPPRSVSPMAVTRVLTCSFREGSSGSP